jgi:flagellar biosynthesis component FlhA
LRLVCCGAISPRAVRAAPALLFCLAILRFSLALAAAITVLTSGQLDVSGGCKLALDRVFDATDGLLTQSNQSVGLRTLTPKIR